MNDVAADDKSSLNSLHDYDWLARRTGICRSTLASMVCRGQVPCVRLAKRIVRFDEAEIQAWIEARRQNVEPNSGSGQTVTSQVGR
jgi:predicted DNA-binding transcriptional regulator AlpA